MSFSPDFSHWSANFGVMAMLVIEIFSICSEKFMGPLEYDQG